jgi:hypothetical protein
MRPRPQRPVRRVSASESCMQTDYLVLVVHKFRIPSEPAPPPIQEPLDPPENPDVPIREPDPEDPGQI